MLENETGRGGGYTSDPQENSRGHQSNPMLRRAQWQRVLGNVKAAKTLVLDSVFVLDDMGCFECPMLTEAGENLSMLVSRWSGRTQPNIVEQQWFADAAREWRRQNGRTY